MSQGKTKLQTQNYFNKQTKNYFNKDYFQSLQFHHQKEKEEYKM